MTYIGRIWLPLAEFDLYWLIVTLTSRICSQSKVFCRSAMLCRFNIPVYLLKYDNWRMRHLWFWTVSDIVGFMQSFDLFTIQTDCVGSLGKSLPTGDSSTINLGDYVKIFEIECRRSVQSARSRCIQPKNWNAWTKSVNNDIFIWRFIAWNCCLLLDWGQV